MTSKVSQKYASTTICNLHSPAMQFADQSVTHDQTHTDVMHIFDNVTITSVYITDSVMHPDATKTPSRVLLFKYRG